MHRFSQWFQSFRRDEGGNVLILTGLSILFLVALAGAGVDFGRQQLVRQKLQQATDAAALAVAAMPETSTQQEKQDAALRYFNLNYPDNYLGIPRPAGFTQLQTDGDQIIVATQQTIDADFISNIGVPTLNAPARTVVSSSTTGNGGDYDIMMTFDNSGSMLWNANSYWGDQNQGRPNRLDAVKEAATIIVSDLLGGGNSNHRIAASSWHSILSGNINFTSDASQVLAFTNNMVARFGQLTNSGEGMRWAANTSSQFRPDSVHVVILLTDGLNTIAGADQATINYCQQLKSQNPATIIYTIAFGQDIIRDPQAPQAYSMLSNCASGTAGSNEGEYFFVAPNRNELLDIFSNILTQVKKIRIVE